MNLWSTLTLWAEIPIPFQLEEEQGALALYRAMSHRGGTGKEAGERDDILSSDSAAALIKPLLYLSEQSV